MEQRSYSSEFVLTLMWAMLALVVLIGVGLVWALLEDDQTLLA